MAGPVVPIQRFPARIPGRPAAASSPIVASITGVPPRPSRARTTAGGVLLLPHSGERSFFGGGTGQTAADKRPTCCWTVCFGRSLRRRNGLPARIPWPTGPPVVAADAPTALPLQTRCLRLLYRWGDQLGHVHVQRGTVTSKMRRVTTVQASTVEGCACGIEHLAVWDPGIGKGDSLFIYFLKPPSASITACPLT